MRRPVLVTGLLVWGCSAVRPDRVGAIHEVDRARPAPPGTRLNAWSDQGGVVYRGGPGACVVYPSDGRTRPPGSLPPPVDVPCPPSMTDPAWDECQGGELSTTATAGECRCFLGGNPPPPERTVRCPPT